MQVDEVIVIENKLMYNKQIKYQKQANQNISYYHQYVLFVNLYLLMMH